MVLKLEVVRPSFTKIGMIQHHPTCHRKKGTIKIVTNHIDIYMQAMMDQ